MEGLYLKKAICNFFVEKTCNFAFWTPGRAHLFPAQENAGGNPDCAAGVYMVEYS